MRITHLLLLSLMLLFAGSTTLAATKASSVSALITSDYSIVNDLEDKIDGSPDANTSDVTTLEWAIDPKAVSSQPHYNDPTNNVQRIVSYPVLPQAPPHTI